MLKSALIAAFALLALPVQAEPNRVTFPPLDQLEHYTTVTRGEVTEHMLTSRTAIEAVKRGEPMPPGTHVVLVDYRGGEVYRYFVMQNGEGWGADDPESRTADWQFQWFWPDRSINLAETTSRCQSCHQSRADRGYLFTYDDLRRFE
jgi:hypothetical protein